MSEKGKKPDESVNGLLPGQTPLVGEGETVEQALCRWLSSFLAEDMQVPMARMLVRGMYEQHGIDAARRVYEYIAQRNRRVGNIGRTQIMAHLEALHRTHQENPNSFRCAIRRRGNFYTTAPKPQPQG
jgi:hypothetical protein